jgi:hypothetical protein
MKNENESPWMTASQFARHRCVSRQHVARLIKTGALPMKGRLIDAMKADALLDDRPDAAEPAAGSTASRYAEARTIRTIFQAKLARLEFETREGKLVERDAVKQRIAGHVDLIRGSLDRFIDTVSPAIAKETDPKKLHRFLTAEIRAELVRLSAIIGGRTNADTPSEDR